MNLLKRLLMLSGIIFLSVSPCFGDEKEYEKGERFKLNPNELHPTQFLFAKIEVDYRVKQLKEIMDTEGEEGVKEFLKSKRGQVVIGPRNSKWLVDGHHLAKALSIVRKTDPRFKKILFYVEVEKEWNELNAQEFERAMKAGNKKGEGGDSAFVYLKDAGGQIRSFSRLPKKLGLMKDSPWRGLVWLLKSSDVIERNERFPYQEFFLAEYLQKHLHLPSKMSSKAYLKAFEEAKKLIEITPDEKLSGFKKTAENNCAKIMKQIQKVGFN